MGGVPLFSFDALIRLLMRHDALDRSGHPRTPAQRALMQGLLDLAWAAYREAGTPFGDTEQALLLWVRFGQDTLAN